MIPAAFEYHTPKSLEEALRLLERHGDEAKLLAGGQSLLPLMKLRLAAPRYVVDLGRVRGLSYIRSENAQMAIGAMTSHADVVQSELLRERCPLLPETATEIGDMQVRNRGTLGGSIAHADPGADYPAAILALDAEIVAASTGKSRKIPAKEFFLDLMTTQLRPGEIITEIRVPQDRARTGVAYRKMHQPASGFAIVGAAARIVLDAAGRAESVALGITGLAPKAFRALAVESALWGKAPSEKLIAGACRAVAEGVEPLGDIHASADYRREMASVYARRALTLAWQRASSSPRGGSGANGSSGRASKRA